MARQETNRRPVRKSTTRRGSGSLAYPLYLFLLLCAGVFLAAATIRASAIDLLVRAKVSAPLVTNKAVITSPLSGDHFTSKPIAITGTCPVNAGYVEIFDNGVMSGVAMCNVGGNFQLAVDLFLGQNTLVAHVFNITDDEGPVSDSVDVVYGVPLPPKTGDGQTSTPGGKKTTSRPQRQPALRLGTDFVFKGYRLGDMVVWPLRITGGQAPYVVAVDWGDKTHDRYNRPTDGAFEISHRYQSLPPEGKSYIIKVTASDAVGSSSFLQFFVIVTQDVSHGAQASIFSKPPPSLGGANWLWYVWPAYLIILAMTLSYWLGEREELIILKRKGLLKRSRRRRLA